MMPYSDDKLVSLLHAGDKFAFETIYRKYMPELMRYAAKNMGRKEDAEEIIQDVFISLWQRHETLLIGSLRQYLYQAVQYKIIRYFQHQSVKRKYAEHYKIFETVYDASSDTVQSPEALHLKIEKCLEALPDRCRQALHLRLTENLSNPEIARRMNITKKTVELYMFKAFNHLREHGKELLELR